MIQQAVRQYSTLAIPSQDHLLYGVSPHPLQCGLGLTIGGGQVFPEVNFTLPPMNIETGTWAEVVAHYDQMAKQILRRAGALATPGIVLEFELLPAMTERPEWGAELTALLKRRLTETHEKHHLACALRVTPTDMRDQMKPPQLRTGPGWECLKRTFELCAEAGADILSVESVGGKEVHDQALMYGDFPGIVFALGVLAPRDMSWLWGEIGAICDRHPGVVPGGDSACGFANTAMQLAHQKMLPEVLAAVVRAMSAVRSLAAIRARGRAAPPRIAPMRVLSSRPLPDAPSPWRASRPPARTSALSATLPPQCVIFGATNPSRTSGCSPAMHRRHMRNCSPTTAG